MFGTAIRQEFRLSRLGFSYEHPQEFATWVWQPKKTDRICGYFIAYRCFAAAFFFAILVADGSSTPHPDHFFIYLTNLGFLLQTIHLVISAALPIQQLLKFRAGNHVKMNMLTKFSWFLYNATNMLTVVITVIYWIVLFQPGSKLKAMNFFVHAFNSITSIFDIFVAKRPCRLLHMYHPFTVFLAYIAFSSIYWASGGRTEVGVSYIYPVLDWENLGLTVPFICIGLFVALPIVHSLLWALHLLRDSCCEKLSSCLAAKLPKSPREGNTNPTFTDEHL